MCRKYGNAFILQDSNGNNKMRTIAHMKKFVEPETVKKGTTDLQPHIPVQPVQPEQDRQHPRPSPVLGDSVAWRTMRARRSPAWI